MKKGRLDVISGPMFSGKSAELIRRLTIQDIAQKKIVVFKHGLDDRFGRPQDISSRNGNYLSAISVTKVAEMNEHLDFDNLDLVGIDEIQFFDRDELVTLCKKLVDEKGISVIVCGLDSDYLQVPFETTAHLMALADSVYKTSAVCMQCRDTDAVYTHRVFGGDNRVEVGSDNYEPRCRSCRVNVK
ncbi:MAG: thymidine kinase [Candidatus Magasanikbacteria bacterium CG_4_10_14_0_8_um_filter_32_14]|uniref:Thymidine kinase n=1 Tax=Candidatus Magasanikbacteria bacterium CG_4_10_14_0_8_um_filter_32_14 TaxID=1974640 RepID=A0A2M7RAB1_9BACT|nr:MAG: thymidine kinase [Candidatus Magasanikbacteria bacterium CG_4_10_14_0_8_um_filter_32_14]